MLIGSPRRRPAGFEKSRADWRSVSGSVCVGTGAEGRSDADFSVEAVGVCCAKPEGTPAARVRTVAATAFNRDPALFLFFCCTNPSCRSTARVFGTRITDQCMIPLHELVGMWAATL